MYYHFLPESSTAIFRCLVYLLRIILITEFPFSTIIDKCTGVSFAFEALVSFAL